MIKVNLLPSYVIEFRNIKKIAIIALIVVVVGLIGVWKYDTDLKDQQAWYQEDKIRCDERVKVVQEYAKGAEELATKAGAYSPWINGFTLQVYQDYVESIAATMSSVGGAIAGRGLWYKTLKVGTTGSFSAEGTIKGAMQFLNYYFRMKDSGFTLEPVVEPYNASRGVTARNYQYEFHIPLRVNGQVGNSMLPTPTLPETGSNWPSLHQPVGGQQQGGTGTPGTTGAPGGAPPSAPVGAPPGGGVPGGG